MASTTYDPIMDALMDLLEAQCGKTFLTYSRRFVTWEDLIQAQNAGKPPMRQPALMLFDGVGLGGGRTRYVQGNRGTPVKRTMTRTIVIYAQIPPQMPTASSWAGPGPDTPGGSVFYPLIESVENALNYGPDASQGVLTLGGRVSHCWIEGDGLIITGEIDPTGQGMATLPVNIMIP